MCWLQKPICENGLNFVTLIQKGCHLRLKSYTKASLLKFIFMRTNVVTVTDELFPNIIGQNKLVLIDFWASWCGPCMKLIPVLEQLADFYTNKAVIGKLDIDLNMFSAKQYNIKTIPTVVVFKESVEVERLSGYHALEKLQQTLDRYLD